MDFLPFEQTGHKCLVCGADNLLSFIDLTLVTSRTSQTNTPVRDKLKNIIKHKWFSMSDVMILCTPCFNMVERYDLLESELLQIRTELSSKYIQTLGPEFEQRMREEAKKKRKDGADDDQDGMNWQQQVPVDLLQPVVNLTADGDSGEDSQVRGSGESDDDSYHRPHKKRRKVGRKKEKQDKEPPKEKKPYTGKPRGRPRKDAPRPRTPTPPPPSDEDAKDKPVYEYDHSYHFFKEGERLRTGQVITSEDIQAISVHCIYCSEMRSEAKEINSHIYSVHKPQVVTTFVPTDDGSQQEYNFGVQMTKVTTDSQALGRPFMCIFCDATFKFKSNLLQHYRENHSPHKPFTCIECKAKFRRSIEVSRHRVYYCPNKKPIPGGRNDERPSPHHQE